MIAPTDAMPVDTGMPIDTGIPPDTGMPLDTGVPSDTGTPMDTGVADTGAGPICEGGMCTGPMCESDAGESTGGICSCSANDKNDADGDGMPDCIDACPDAPDRSDDGTCGCAAAARDNDGDGTPNCTDLCPYDSAKTSPGVCGCSNLETDSDSDGTPNCADACMMDKGKIRPGVCGCGVSEQDTDLDGMPDCVDACKGGSDASYVVISTCGVGYCRDHNVPSSCVAGNETACAAAAPLGATDSTCDGIDDDCDGKTDENFVMAASSCGKGVCARAGTLTCVAGKTVDSCAAGTPTAATDTTCNNLDEDCSGVADEDFVVTMTACGTGACIAMGSTTCVNGMLVNSCAAKMQTSPTDTTCNNIDEDCSGVADEDFMTMSTNCGVGVCARTGATSCVKGSVLNSCTVGAPTGPVDNSCNNKDDDCNGRVDEDFVVAATNCGTGACASTGSTTCTAGVTKNSCVAKTPATTIDDSFVPGNGIDDDCDGKIDENVPACNTTPIKYDAGSYPSITVPGNCHSVSVKAWGGGGGSGQSVGSSAGGDGAPGGFATASVQVAGTISLSVGGGAASGCNAGGSNAGSGSYAGGSGGGGTGNNGADGVVAGGGSGGAPGTGNRGGNGYFGGGGGGQAKRGGLDLGTSGTAGGGGAATVFIVNGVRAAVAGGGGGGGGSQGVTLLGTISSRGGNGGSGCRGAGQVATTSGGGGGGGGMCQGATTQAGSGTAPASAASIPGGRATGGAGDCRAGGAGYAIVTFSP